MNVLTKQEHIDAEEKFEREIKEAQLSIKIETTQVNGKLKIDYNCKGNDNEIFRLFAAFLEAEKDVEGSDNIYGYLFDLIPRARLLQMVFDKNRPDVIKQGELLINKIEHGILRAEMCPNCIDDNPYNQNLTIFGTPNGDGSISIGVRQSMTTTVLELVFMHLLYTNDGFRDIIGNAVDATFTKYGIPLTDELLKQVIESGLNGDIKNVAVVKTSKEKFDLMQGMGDVTGEAGDA